MSSESENLEEINESENNSEGEVAQKEAEEAAERAFARFAVLDTSVPASGLLPGIRLEGILSADCG